MANKRIHYGVEQVCIEKLGVVACATEVHGLQSVGIDTKFNLEQIFEIGQLEIYENIENLPDISVTLEKVLDGYPLMYHLATNPSTSATLSGRSNTKCELALAIFTDTQDTASGTPLTICFMSGLFCSSLSYTFPVEGSFTESVTLVGNNKTWATNNPVGLTCAGQFNNTDVPAALGGSSGGVQRREDLIFDSAVTNYTLLPPDVDGISSSGTNNRDSNGDFSAHIQSIKVSTDLGRTNMFELGRRAPYHRYVEFPVEVKCDIEVMSTRGDLVEATENGVQSDGSNLLHRTIRIKTREGTLLDLGTKNKLSSTNYGGANANAKGGNATTTYSFSNFNSLTVTHPMDPSGL
jgi:hypothetical protein